MGDQARLEERLARHMADQGLKQTRQRQVIFEAFVALEGHASIDELLEAVQAQRPGIGYATVYRTMKLFTEAGVAHERRFGDGQARYEPVMAGGHHDHLICETCGHIFEFEDEMIERRQEAVARNHGMRIISHHHDIVGACLNPGDCEFRLARAAEQKG